MFAVRNTKSILQAQKLGQTIRQNSVLSGPPTEQISSGEKLVHGLVMVTGFLAVPAWVLVNIKHYKAGK